MEISTRWHAVEEAGDDAPENAVTQRSRVHILKIERRHREALHTRCESKLKANYDLETLADTLDVR